MLTGQGNGDVKRTGLCVRRDLGSDGTGAMLRVRTRQEALAWREHMPDAS